MKFGKNKKAGIDIEDYYSIKIGSMWAGLRQESAAFWWLCIYVFFEYVRPQSIYPAIDIIPWAQITLLLSMATAYFDKSIKYPKNPTNTLLIIFYCIVFLSIIFAFNTAVSLESINTVLNWIIAYFLVITIVNSEKRFLIFVLLFMLVSFKMSQHGFRTFALRGFSFSGWGVSGAPGWFQNSGEFGIQMVIFTPLSIAFILALRKYWGRVKRIIFYLMPVTALFSIIGTSSRGALLGITVVAVWFVIKSKVGIKAVFGILLVGWIIYAAMPSEFKAEFDTMGEDTTSVDRLDLWEFGVETALKNPVLGVGYSNWLVYCWFENPEGIGPTEKCHEAHNTFVECAAELGISGLLVFILLIIAVFRQNSKTKKYAKQANNKFIFYIAQGLDGGLIGYMVSGFFISTLFYPFFWFQLAMTVALHEVSKRQVHDGSDLQKSM